MGEVLDTLVALGVVVGIVLAGMAPALVAIYFQERKERRA